MHSSPGHKIKLGIIGTGLAARELHLPALKSLSEYFQITAICNRSEPKAISFAEIVGLTHYYKDYHKMLAEADVEAVLLTLPIEHNYSVSRDCAEAGKHILCEKPLAVDLEQARKMIELPSQYNIKLQIAEQFYYPSYLRFGK